MRKKLLASILTVCMLFTMLPTAAFAAEENIAAEDTLQAQINAAERGTTITLEKEYTESISIPTGKEIILNLNGKTLTGTTNASAIINYGTLTLKGSGKIENKKDYAVDNQGTMKIEGSLTVTDGVDAKASLIRNGDDNVAATLTIDGGTFTGGMNTVKNEPAGTLVINGGTFNHTNGPKGQTGTILNYGKATLNGGEFKSNTRVVNTSGESTTIINDGTYGQGTESYLFGSVNPVINGGTFKIKNIKQNSVRPYVTNGKKVLVTDDSVQVVDTAPDAYNAKINDEVYYTGTSGAGQAIQDASVVTEGKEVVTLNQSVTSSKKLTMPKYTLTVILADGVTCEIQPRTGYTIATRQGKNPGEVVYYNSISEENAVAKVTNGDSVFYCKSFQDAVAYTATSGDTVTLLKDDTYTETKDLTFKFEEVTDGSVTIDLNGKKFETSKTLLVTSVTRAGGTVTILDSSKTGTGAIVSTGTYVVKSQNSGNVKIESGYFEAKGSSKGDIMYSAKQPIQITGGTFSHDVSKYVPANYECVKPTGATVYSVQKMESKLVVDKGSVAEDKTQSATLEGDFAPNAPVAGDDASTVEGYDVSLDLSNKDESGTKAATVNLTVTKDTAQSLADASSLSVTTDAGEVKLDAAALDKVGKTNGDVVITVQKNDVTGTEVKASYTVSVQTGETNLLPYGASNNGTVTITVEKPEDAKVAWYVATNGENKVYVEKLNAEFGGEKVVIPITHLSTIELLTDDPETTAVATVTTSGGTVAYTDLQTAIDSANNGDTVTLLQNVTLDGTGKGNNEGLLTINKNITLNGNGKTLTAKNVTVNGTQGPSMVNIQDGAEVTVRDLTIDGNAGNANTKHGLNVYGDATTVTVENVIIKNGNGYGIVVNGAQATINGLTTSNNGWGGINVDSKSGAASLTVNNATIGEQNSVKIENGAADPQKDPVVEIKNGSFQYITKGDEIAKPNMTVSGGKFATGNAPAGSVNIADHLAPGLAVDGSGNVYVPSTGGGSYEPSGDYVVSVDKTVGGKVTVNPGRADKGDTVTITVRPDKGYELDSLIVTAKDGGAVKLTEKSANKFTFKMPGSKVTVEAVFVKEGSEKPVVTLPFADVNKGDWFYDAVAYVYGNDLMNGTSAAAFSPYLTTSRAMMLTMLARYDGTDTAAGSTWYEAGAVWAVSKGISDGTNLEADLTREQLVTMLWRYAGSPVVESGLSAYPDGAAVSDWAVNAMIWASNEGVITGNGAGALNPQGTATRAEVATILARFCTMEG